MSITITRPTWKSALILTAVIGVAIFAFKAGLGYAAVKADDPMPAESGMRDKPAAKPTNMGMDSKNGYSWCMENANPKSYPKGYVPIIVYMEIVKNGKLIPGTSVNLRNYYQVPNQPGKYSYWPVTPGAVHSGCFIAEIVPKNRVPVAVCQWYDNSIFNFGPVGESAIGRANCREPRMGPDMRYHVSITNVSPKPTQALAGDMQ